MKYLNIYISMKLSTVSMLWEELTEKVEERQSHYFLLPVFHVILPLFLHFLFEHPKKQFSTKPWKEETIDGNQS